MSKSVLDSGIKLVRNVSRYNIGKGSLAELPGLLAARRAAEGESGGVVFLIDEYFSRDSTLAGRLGFRDGDLLRYVQTKDEPKTDGIDASDYFRFLTKLFYRISGALAAARGARAGCHSSARAERVKQRKYVQTNAGDVSPPRALRRRQRTCAPCRIPPRSS